MIRQLRQKKGWTQAQLAAEAGFDRIATVSDLETGKNDNPQLSTLLQVAAALGVSARDLFAPSVDDKTEVLIREFEGLPPADRDVVLGMIRHLASRR